MVTLLAITASGCGGMRQTVSPADRMQQSDPIRRAQVRALIQRQDQAVRQNLYAHLAPGTEIYRLPPGFHVVVGGASSGFPADAVLRHTDGELVVVYGSGRERRFPNSAVVVRDEFGGEYYVAPGAAKPASLNGRHPDAIVRGSL